MSSVKKQTDGLIDIGSLSKEQEQEIFTAIKRGDSALKSRLIESGISKVGKIAKRYVSSEASFEWLYATGCEAVAECVHAFNYRMSESFASYLKRRIEDGMKGCYDRLARFLPIDCQTIQLHDRYELALLELYPDCNNAESPKVQDEEYVADYLGVTVEKLRAMKSEYDKCRIVSLSQSVKLDKSLPDDYVDGDIDNKSPLLETIVDPASENGAAEYLDDLMDCLTEDERQVVCARDGVLSVKARTDGQIASELGIDENKVEVIYQTAIDKMKKQVQ